MPRSLLLLWLVLAPALTEASLVVWRGDESKPLSSIEYEVAPFDRAVLSWNASGPAAFEIEVDGRRHRMGEWSPTPKSAKTEYVDIDTLVLRQPRTRFRFHVQPSAGTRLTLAAVTFWSSRDKRQWSESPSAVWGKTLPVPTRSQLVEKKDPRLICSPTSLAMVLEFLGFKKATHEIAAGVYDHAQKIYGNWPFNTAYAHSVSGLEAYVVRATGLADLEAEIAAGRPAVTSLQWKPGELDGAALPRSSGHLMTVVGFSANGDVVVNDPAAKPTEIRRTYKRRQFFDTWKDGIMYVVKK